MKKTVKEIKKKLRKNRKKIVRDGFLIVLLLFFWAWLFYTTQPATEENTYQRCETILDVEVHLAHHGGRDELYLISQNHRYMLDTTWRNENKSYKLAETILSGNRNYTITVWEHFPRHLFEIIRGKSIQVYQVTDLRNGENIYWNIADHNSLQRSERIAGIIGGILFFSDVVIAIIVFDIWISDFYGICSGRRRRKRKKK